MAELSVWERVQTAGRHLWALGKAMLPTVLAFLILGPVVGYFAIMLPFLVANFEAPRLFVMQLAGLFVFLPYASVFAYMIGYAPALLTGLVIAAADSVLDLGPYRPPTGIVTGALITMGLYAWVADFDLPERWSEAGGLAVAGSIGAIAGGVCALIAPRRAPSWPSA